MRFLRLPLDERIKPEWTGFIYEIFKSATFSNDSSIALGIQNTGFKHGLSERQVRTCLKTLKEFGAYRHDKTMRRSFIDFSVFECQTNVNKTNIARQDRGNGATHDRQGFD